MGELDGAPADDALGSTAGGTRALARAPVLATHYYVE